MTTILPIPPSRKADWRVDFWDFTDHHDWIGRGSVRRGATYKKLRAKPPKKQSREFFTRDAAEQFCANLRADHGDEIAATIVDQRKPLRTSVPPQNEFLPGDWPLQLRDDR
jgi:hypothetical protein